jgi:HSP20 family protein
MFLRAPTMGQLQEQMNRLLSQFREGLEGDSPPEGLGQWTPRLDMLENDDSFVAMLDVPGLVPEDLQISIADGMLSVQGTRKPQAATPSQVVHVSERPFGAFARSVRLPGVVDVEKVAAEARNGVLTVTLPKKPEARPRQVSIKVK